MRTKLRKIKFQLTKNDIKTFNHWYDVWTGILQSKIDALDSILIIYTGDRGAGKSTCAIKDGLSVDPEFSADQICFTKQEILDAIFKHSYSGGTKIILFDEFGAEMQARDWWKESQKFLVKCLVAMRDTKVSLFACMPHLKFADYVAEALGTFCIEIRTPAHKQVPYRYGKALEIWGFHGTRKSREFKPIWYEGKIFHIPYIDPISDYPDLFQEYQTHKKAYILDLLSEDLESQEPELTRTQSRYLKALLKGKSNKEVAEEFRVSRDSVKEMKRKLRHKGYKI